MKILTSRMVWWSMAGIYLASGAVTLWTALPPVWAVHRAAAASVGFSVVGFYLGVAWVMVKIPSRFEKIAMMGNRRKVIGERIGR